MSGPAVTVVSSGGLPVRVVTGGAPAMTAKASGGLPVTLATVGAPFVVEGLSIPLLAGNLMIAPDALDNGAWGKSQATITPNAALAPDGTMTADLFVPSTANALHIVSQGTTTGAGQTMTFTLYAKPAGYNIIGIRENFVTGNSAGYSLTGSGTATVNAGAGGGSATITALANGWYRCTFTTAATSANMGLGLFIMNSGTDPLVSFAGNGTSGVYFWHNQAVRP